MHWFSARGISLFLLATGRIQKGTKGSDHSEWLSLREHGSNQSILCYEEFLHTKINKTFCVYYDATEDILKDLCSLRQYGGRFDSIKLK